MNWLMALIILATPLPKDLADDLKSMALDPPEIHRAIHLHYLYGNEYKLELFVPYIRNKGGVYVGVGADQNYNLAAHARPDLMILIDYDEMVVMVHMIHTAMLAASETVDEFIGRYEKDQMKTSLEILERAWKGHPKWPKLQAFYPKARKTLSKVVKVGRHLGTKGKLIYFLADEEQFRFIRDLARAGRILPMDGNLLGGKTIANLSAVLKKHKLQVEVLYLSNAEQYWKPLPKAFKKNIAAIPFADDGLIVRTVSWTSERWSADGYYHYNVQKGRHLQDFFSEWKKRITIRALIRFKAKGIKPGFSTLGLDPRN